MSKPLDPEEFLSFKDARRVGEELLLQRKIIAGIGPCHDDDKGTLLFTSGIAFKVLNTVKDCKKIIGVIEASKKRKR